MTIATTKRTQIKKKARENNRVERTFVLYRAKQLEVNSNSDETKKSNYF